MNGKNYPENQPELSVILVNYNGRSYLEKCLSSLEENTQNIDHEIIVIDNDSSDGSREMVKSKFSRIKLIHSKENLGYSRANNLGVKTSQGEYLLFLNPDTVIYPGSVKVLLEALKANPELGGVGPALLLGKNKYQVSFGNRVNFFSELLQKCILNHYYRMRLKTKKKNRKVRWLSGACFLARLDTIKDVGGFDEEFFLYFEDIDLCKRMSEKGWRLCFFPEAEIFHYGGVSTAAIKLNSRFFYRKSQIYFYHKHNSNFSQLLLRIYLRIAFFFLLFWGYLTNSKDIDCRKDFFQLLRQTYEKN